ncbi:MAG TPA: tetratricopeptide repeat protein [Kofleriaceae bacterium]|jgi:hypothetical protein|nr:tetratricopeptide repeat protein [Kofleriaceae bacterium]
MTELSTASKEIVRDGRSALTPTDEQCVRLRAGIAARLAAGAIVAAPATAAATTGGAASAGATIKLALLVAAIGAGGGTTWLLLSDGGGRPEAPATVPVPAAVDSAHPADLVPSPPAPPAPPSPPPAPPVRRRAHAEAPAADEPAVPGLADEVRMLEPARRALEERQPAAALSALDVYDQALPRGQLAREATLLRAEALCQLGRTDEARGLLRRVAEAHPGAPGIAATAAACGLDREP